MKMTADERARRCTANLFEAMRAAGRKVEQANVHDAMAAAIDAAVHVETQEMARVIDALHAPRIGSDADSAVVAARALRLAFDATIASAASLRAQLDAVRAAVIECAYCNGVGEMVRLPGDVTEPCPACGGLRKALRPLPSTPDPAGTAPATPEIPVFAALDWMRSPAAPFVWNFDLHGEGDLAALLAAYAAHVLLVPRPAAPTPAAPLVADSSTSNEAAKSATRDPSTCPHENVVPEAVDQTLGVACNDCNVLLGACWMDGHVSEALWNKACANRPDEGTPCEQSRTFICFLCGEPIAEDEDATPAPEGEQAHEKPATVPDPCCYAKDRGLPFHSPDCEAPEDAAGEQADEEGGAR